MIREYSVSVAVLSGWFNIKRGIRCSPTGLLERVENSDNHPYPSNPSSTTFTDVEGLFVRSGFASTSLVLGLLNYINLYSLFSFD